MTSKNGVSLSYDSMNRLTGWGGQSYSYDDLGNITHQPLVGDFSYSGYRVTELEPEDSLLFDDSLRISYYKAIERPRRIENQSYRADILYDGNGDRFLMKVFKKEGGEYRPFFTRYYLDSKTEITKDSLGHKTYLYYAGDDAYTAPAVMVSAGDGTSSIYAMIRDNIGSVIQYENTNYSYYRNSFSPWGVRTYQAGGSTFFYRPGEEPGFGPFYRTYTGHEDLWMFGLLNANARLYSPYLGRFVSPDPLLTEDGSPLDFNPYVYARNNPYRYIDRNGEFWWFAAFTLAGIALDVYNNRDNIHDVWDALGFAFTGFVAGAVSSIVGPAAAGVLGLGTSGAVSLAVPGFISGVTSNVFRGALDSAVMGVPYSFNWQSCLMEAGFSAVTAGVIGGFVARANGANFWTGEKRLGLIYPK